MIYQQTKLEHQASATKLVKKPNTKTLSQDRPSQILVFCAQIVGSFPISIILCNKKLESMKPIFYRWRMYQRKRKW